MSMIIPPSFVVTLGSNEQTIPPFPWMSDSPPAPMTLKSNFFPRSIQTEVIQPMSTFEVNPPAGGFPKLVVFQPPSTCPEIHTQTLPVSMSTTGPVIISQPNDNDEEEWGNIVYSESEFGSDSGSDDDDDGHFKGPTGCYDGSHKRGHRSRWCFLFGCGTGGGTHHCGGSRGILCGLNGCGGNRGIIPNADVKPNVKPPTGAKPTPKCPIYWPAPIIPEINTPGTTPSRSLTSSKASGSTSRASSDGPTSTTRTCTQVVTVSDVYISCSASFKSKTSIGRTFTGYSIQGHTTTISGGPACPTGPASINPDNDQGEDRTSTRESASPTRSSSTSACTKVTFSNVYVTCTASKCTTSVGIPTTGCNIKGTTTGMSASGSACPASLTVNTSEDQGENGSLSTDTTSATMDPCGGSRTISSVMISCTPERECVIRTTNIITGGSCGGNQIPSTNNAASTTRPNQPCTCPLDQRFGGCVKSGLGSYKCGRQGTFKVMQTRAATGCPLNGKCTRIVLCLNEATTLPFFTSRRSRASTDCNPLPSEPTLGDCRNTEHLRPNTLSGPSSINEDFF
ncbi:hypothetical protein M501DRAFT_1031100 [Patellaria atrata CBS 101060]|uniref:Uncharacterized protein n=1 Tax=Patellaria atrata CBS 101060 TaxID=1346257 RepID=A0A9P4SC93_9PEZI|nr:hypothetical protein M501DRAFT_1031100 [Patellaria atrata CBS 101060]